VTARRIAALTVIFCGMALAFSGFSFAALGRGGSAALAGVGGLVLVVIGSAALPRAGVSRMAWRPAARMAPCTRRVSPATGSLLFLSLLLPPTVFAQETVPIADSAASSDAESNRTRFASFDVGFGVVLP